MNWENGREQIPKRWNSVKEDGGNDNDINDDDENDNENDNESIRRSVISGGDGWGSSQVAFSYSPSHKLTTKGAASCELFINAKRCSHQGFGSDKALPIWWVG